MSMWLYVCREIFEEPATRLYSATRLWPHHQGWGDYQSFRARSLCIRDSLVPKSGHMPFELT